MSRTLQNTHPLHTFCGKSPLHTFCGKSVRCSCGAGELQQTHDKDSPAALLSTSGASRAAPSPAQAKADADVRHPDITAL